MDPDIGTTIQCNDIFLVDVATLAEEAENQIDLFLVETLLVEICAPTPMMPVDVCFISFRLTIIVP